MRVPATSCSRPGIVGVVIFVAGLSLGYSFEKEKAPWRPARAGKALIVSA